MKPDPAAMTDAELDHYRADLQAELATLNSMAMNKSWLLKLATVEWERRMKGLVDQR